MNPSLRESKLHTPFTHILHHLISSTHNQFLNLNLTIDHMLFNELLINVCIGSRHIQLCILDPHQTIEQIQIVVLTNFVKFGDEVHANEISLLLKSTIIGELSTWEDIAIILNRFDIVQLVILSE